MDTFSEPSLEKAQFLLRELKWGEQFQAIEMSPAAGNRTLYLYSMKEAAQLLRYGTAGMGLTSGGRSTICWFESDDFVSWVRDKLQDVELAEVLHAAAQKETFYDQVSEMGHIFDERYTQLKKIIEKQEGEKEYAAMGDETGAS